MTKYFIIIALIFLHQNFLDAQTETSSIYGRILDRITQQPVIGANVIILETNFGAATDTNGNYTIENIPPGTYQLRASSVGFSSITKTSVILMSAKPVQVDFQLQEQVIEIGGVIITSDYFNNDPYEVNSIRKFNYEEIRRSPGGFEDVIRALSILPGVAQADAGRNDLIVRGGAPSENLYIIDGLEIPNINHFGTQGATGGPLSYINLDFVKETSFSTGGFSSLYGDKLSSVLSIDIRNGRNDRFGGKATISASQFGLNLEGPISENSDFIFSIRRSYLDFIFKAAGFGFVPEYYDLLSKYNFKIDGKNSISFLFVGAYDNVKYFNDTEDQRYDNSRILGSDQKQYFTNLKYRNIFNNGFIDVNYGRSYTSFNTSQRDSILNPIFNNIAEEEENSLKSDLTIKFSKQFEFNAGMGFKVIRVKNDILFPAFITTFGDTLPVNQSFTDNHFNKFSSYFNLHSVFFERLSTNVGARIDYFNPLAKSTVLTPRFSLSYQITELTSINFSAGTYSQAPSYVWFAYSPNKRKLNYIKNNQFVIGTEHRISEDTQVKIEGFYKEYKDYPASELREYLVLANTGAGYSGSDDNFSAFGLEPLVSSGTGTARGVEFSAQKKLSDTPFYGVLSLTYSKAGFIPLDGISRTGSYDQTWIFNISGGYNFNDEWEASIKFRYSTGKPYTPYNADGTQSINNFNSLRLPDNHSLDLRIDRRWNFIGWTLITYIDIQNIYNRKNISGIRWDFREMKVDDSASIGILPSIGISAEF